MKSTNANESHVNKGRTRVPRHDAMAGVGVLWQRYMPEGEDVARDVIKDLIKVAIFFALVQMGVKLAS